MGRFIAGFALAAAVAAGLYLGLVQGTGDSTCDDRCGEGTSCDSGQCVVAASDVPPDEVATPTKKKKKRRKKSRSKGSKAGVAFVSDAGVPRYDRTKTKVLAEGTGSERLSDRTVNRELAKLDPAFQKCIATAAAAADEDLPSGRVRYEFGIAASGKVTGVNARAPKLLSDLGVVACVRKAIHGHRFPKFDGLEMGAEGSFSI